MVDFDKLNVVYANRNGGQWREIGAFQLAGVEHRNLTNDDLDVLASKCPVTIEPDIGNQHDENAMRVVCSDPEYNTVQFGFMHRDVAKLMRFFHDTGFQFMGRTFETQDRRYMVCVFVRSRLLDSVPVANKPPPASPPSPPASVDKALAPVGAVEPSPVEEEFYQRLALIELPGESVAVWLKHRMAISKLDGDTINTLWGRLVSKTASLMDPRRKVSDAEAKQWLKKAIAEEDLRANNKKS